jgi:hypothetical protein
MSVLEGESSTPERETSSAAVIIAVMLERVRHLVWFAIIATAVSYCLLVVIGNFVTASAENNGPLLVHDVVKPGAHNLSGMLMVPSACDQLSVHPEKVSASTYMLAFQTWQDASVPCPPRETPREFNAIVLSSSSVQFLATLNGNGFPIRIISK